DPPAAISPVGPAPATVKPPSAPINWAINFSENPSAGSVLATFSVSMPGSPTCANNTRGVSAAFASRQTVPEMTNDCDGKAAVWPPPRSEAKLSVTVPVSVPAPPNARPALMSTVSVAPGANATIDPDADAPPLTDPTLTSSAAEPAGDLLVMLI